MFCLSPWLEIIPIVVKIFLSLKYSNEKQPKKLGHKQDWASVYKGNVTLD